MIESGKDAASRLLDRSAFLCEMAKREQSNASARCRGCLLVLQFPVIKALAAVSNDADTGDDPSDDAMRHLLAILETRARTRDPMGRIARHSIGILLRGCRPPNAVIVADQYAALLRDIVISDQGRQLPMRLRYRVVPLDKQEHRSISGTTRVISGPSLHRNTRLSKQLEVAGNNIDLTVSKIVSLNAARVEKKHTKNDAAAKEVSPGNKAQVLQLGVQNRLQSWRMRPGMLLLRQPLICCYRLQFVGTSDVAESLKTSPLFAKVLEALALNDGESRPLIESQIIMPVNTRQIHADFPQWVTSRCKHLRVAPSDICLSINVDSLALDLRRVGPLLRQLNHKGIRLMLEGATSAAQLRLTQKIAQFDYLYLSGRTMTDSYAQSVERADLVELLEEAKRSYCEVCAGGIDTAAMIDHGLAMKVDIGFGRECGGSTAFPTR